MGNPEHRFVPFCLLLITQCFTGARFTAPSMTTTTKTTAVTAKEPLPTLLSQEDGGAQPFEHAGGVGALPGSRSEEGVAVLPEEKAKAAAERDREQRVGALGLGALGSQNDEANPTLKLREHDNEDSKIGESAVMAERARTAGAEKAADMNDNEGRAREEHSGAWDSGLGGDKNQTETSKVEEKARGKESAAAIGAAVGAGEMQRKEQNEQKPVTESKPAREEPNKKEQPAQKEQKHTEMKPEQTKAEETKEKPAEAKEKKTGGDAVPGKPNKVSVVQMFFLC